MSDENRNYEATIVLNVKGEESVDDLISTVGQEMEDQGAKLDKVDKIGKREFAYNARKQPSGYYVNYHFSAAPSAINEVQAKLKLNTDIYLQHYALKA